MTIEDELKELADKLLEKSNVLNLLKDRPCTVCKNHTGNGCTAWDCPFDKVTQVPQNDEI